MKRYSLKEFIEKAKSKHNNFYGYEKSIYVNNSIKLIITCKIHGDFEQTPANHLFGQGCNKCGIIRSSKKQRFGEKEFENQLKNGKKCYTCKKFKKVSEFYNDKSTWDGFTGVCKNCINKDKKLKIKINPEYRLKVNVRRAIHKYLKGEIKGKSTIEILGCTKSEFLEHLNNNKYGFKYENGKYDLDHIIPVSKANTKKEVLKLNHYTNFQLLPSYYNRYIKKDKKFDKEHFENWLVNQKIHNTLNYVESI